MLFRSKLLPHHNVSSAGVFTSDGQAASENAIKAAKQNDVDISTHKSRQITEEIAKNSDIILCMTQGHKAALSSVKSKCFTLGEYASVKEEVSDPFGGSFDAYINCFNQLERLLTAVAEKIQNEHNTI